MEALGVSLISTIYHIVSTVLTLYTIIIIAAAIISWVRPDPYNPIVRFLRAVTEPLFYRLRKWFPFLVVGGIDLSPIVVLILIQAIKYFLATYMQQLTVVVR